MNQSVCCIFTQGFRKVGCSPDMKAQRLRRHSKAQIPPTWLPQAPECRIRVALHPGESRAPAQPYLSVSLILPSATNTKTKPTSVSKECQVHPFAPWSALMQRMQLHVIRGHLDARESRVLQRCLWSVAI
jgi:hypothetical protein